MSGSIWQCFYNVLEIRYFRILILKKMFEKILIEGPLFLMIN